MSRNNNRGTTHVKQTNNNKQTNFLKITYKLQTETTNLAKQKKKSYNFKFLKKTKKFKKSLRKEEKKMFKT
jgi:hypothetical protein